jgi:sodium/potassium-transporting ATPase subunit alpha
MADEENGGQGCFSKMKGANGDTEKQKNLRKDLPIVAHEFSLEELAAEYNVSFERGLTSAQVLESRQKHGENRLTPPKVKPAW